MSNSRKTELSSGKDFSAMLSAMLKEIFNIEIEHLTTNHNDHNDYKVTGIKFTLPQGSKNVNDIILELLNLYIVPAFILPNDIGSETKIVHIKVNDKKSNKVFVVEKYTRDNNTYVDPEQTEQQSSDNWRQKLEKRLKQLRNLAQNLTHGKEEIEFIEMNKDKDKDKFNFDLNPDTSTEVNITFASSEINIGHVKKILECVSNFKKLINDDAIKPLIEINHHQLVAELKDKLSICPFFAKKTIKSLLEDKTKEQEIVLCLTSNQNADKLVKSIFGGDQSKINYRQKEYPFFSYYLNNVFLGNVIQLFNEKSQTIEKQFSERIKIDQKEGNNNSDEVEIKIKNVTCSSSSLRYENGNLPLKELASEEKEKVYFGFDVKVSDLKQIDNEELKHIYDSMIYKITSLISFFDLCFSESKFSIVVEVYGKNIFSINESLVSKILDINYYSELVYTICNKFQNKEEVLKLFYNKRVTFQLEAESQKIQLDHLHNIESLISIISVLNAQSKAFLDTVGDPLVHCYLSNFSCIKDNKISCVYAVTHPFVTHQKDLQTKELECQFRESFSRCFDDLKSVPNNADLLVYSMTIDINKLPNNPINEPEEVQNIENAVEVTKELKPVVESIDAQPQSQTEYDVDWHEKCFSKIGYADDFVSLEQSLKEASTFVHTRLMHVCHSLLKKIETLQLGKEQITKQDNKPLINESTAQDTLNKNISSFNSFLKKKVGEFNAIKLNLEVSQRKTIASIGNNMLNAVQSYQEMVRLNLFINKKITDLPKTLEENVDKLEKLMSDDNEEQEITPDYVCKLFQKLSKKLDEWENLSVNSQSDKNNDQTIFSLFKTLKTKINQCIELQEKNGKLVKKYQQMRNSIHFIYYSDLTRVETTVREIAGSALDCLEGELKSREGELKKRKEQETNRVKIGSETIGYIGRGLLSLYNKVKNVVKSVKEEVDEPKNESPSEKFRSYNNTSSYNGGYGSGNNSNCRDNNQSYTGRPNFDSDNIINLPGSFDQLHKHKGIFKAMFSEKENYAFLALSIVGIGAILAYFVGVFNKLCQN